MSQKVKASPKPSPKNTLFNYFSKNTINTSSSAEKFKKPETEKLSAKKLDFDKRPIDSSDEEEEVVSSKTKKRKLIVSDEEDIENTDRNASKLDNFPIPKKRLVSKEDHEDESINNTSKKLAKFIENSATTKTDSSSLNLADLRPGDDKNSAGLAIETDNKIYQHEKLEFLQPENIRDINKNRPNNPNYDPRTLYVPDSFLKLASPGHLQWWNLKALYFDCILFFKVGKFYELYHQDAVIGVKELGLTFMKGDYAHSGFPETAYDKMASTLVERGFKVARVEQTETPAMMENRCKIENKRSKYDKVVKREVCQVTNIATQNFSAGLCAMSKGQYSANSNYLMVLAEKKISSLCSRYGIVFVDTTIGDFMIGEFDDDHQCSRLLTLLSLYTPVLLLHERTGTGERTMKLLKGINVAQEKLTNEKQFWNGSKAIEFLAESIYKNEKDWPECLQNMKDNLQPSGDFVLAWKALGGCLWYLKYNLLDQQVLLLATFKQYIPPDQKFEGDASDIKIPENSPQQTRMVLDAITLHNLNVNCHENSLIAKLDYCCTQFGKRLLREIVCTPCCDIEEIKNRQNAIKELKDNVELLTNCRSLLSSLNIDVQRNINQISQFGNKEIAQNHPQSRAILYESETYGKNKILDFAAAIDALEQLMSIPSIFKRCESSMLKMLTQTRDNAGNFIDLTAHLSKLKKSFDIEQAKKNGYIMPETNADDEYDAVLDEISSLETEIKAYLKEQEKIVGCKLNYFGQDRKRYQIEVPESHFKKVPKSYHLENSKGKGKNTLKRYTTDETKLFLARMQELEAKKKGVLDDFGRRIFEKFSKNYSQFKQIIEMTAKLDVLASFAEYARNLSIACMPEIHKMATAPGESFIIIENGIHPLMNPDDFIPNSINIGHDGHFELITGPNMGGKSTLMRQVALLSIQAQIGSFVPAESMSLTIIDRIFTRLGANDNIMKSQSTFLVELDETAVILKHCSFNSLILLDELGRGTSTYDGTAIAKSVANFLADTKCRTLFSTHYHSLVNDFQDDERIKLGHMACVVENENSEDITKENVTFLYKYGNGSCPRSFGFNAAKLAGIDHKIIRRAHEISKTVEAENLKLRIKKKILQNANKVEIQKLVEKFKKCLD